MTINSSVGHNGFNARQDVIFIQKCLNALEFTPPLSKLSEDGRFGPLTQAAITRFQRDYVRMANPDGRIDPCGRTIKVLAAQRSAQEKPIRPLSMVASGAVRTIHYRSAAEPVLSQYTLSVIKHVMVLADVTAVDVSSTWRSPEKQAQIMYDDNSAAALAGVSVDSYRRYRYAAAGQAVDKIYTDHGATKSKADILALMVDEIGRRLVLGERVSKHCVSWAEYQQNNILDIPYSSVSSRHVRDFEEALMAYSSCVHGRHFTRGDFPHYVVSQRPIEKMIIERRCWHIEIPQGQRQLPLLP